MRIQDDVERSGHAGRRGAPFASKLAPTSAGKHHARTRSDTHRHGDGYRKLNPSYEKRLGAGGKTVASA